MTLLSPGDQFPSLRVTSGKGPVDLPGDLSGHFAVVLFNRGAWCPFCTAQLTAFNRALPKLDDNDIQVVALWADDEASTQKFVNDRSIGFALGHSADVTAIAAATGAFVNADPVYLQSTGFVLDPRSRVVTSVYASGAIGRLMPDDVIGLVNYTRQHAA